MELTKQNETVTSDDLVPKAAEALRASVKTSYEIVGVMDSLAGRNGFKLGLSDLNRTATFKAMRRNADAVLRFVDSLEAGR